MKEEDVIRTSELDDHFRTLAMQLKDVEEKLRLHPAGSSSPFGAATLARILSPTVTPYLTPTPLSTWTVKVHADLSPSTTIADVASTSVVASITTNDAVECIDAADANERIIRLQHLHTYNYILSLTKGDEFAKESFVEESCHSRWPKK